MYIKKKSKMDIGSLLEQILGRKLKKQWNMKVTVIPVGVGAFGIVFKGLEERQWELEIS